MVPRLRPGGRWLVLREPLEGHPPRRVFLAEVLACACGGTRRVIAVLEAGPACRKVLPHLDLPDTAPEAAPARINQADFSPTGAPAPPVRNAPCTDDLQRSPDDFPS